MPRHALVCGASSGIGRAAALALARQGHEVTVVARRADMLAEVAEACVDEGAKDSHAVIADFDDRRALYRAIEEHATAHPVDILVHNTGGPPGGPLLDASEEDIHRAMARHLLTAQGLAQRLVPGMVDRRWGRIICITSLSVRQPIVGLGVSNTVRAAMAAWAKTLSKELPPGITVNTVLPGYTDTERLAELAQTIAQRVGGTPEGIAQGWADGSPEKRLADPAEVAEAVAWLASDAASFVRGMLLPVDGGRLDAL